MRNPFSTPQYGRGVQLMDAASRIEAAKKFSAAQCQAALAVLGEPGLQKTVLQAIERRLRKLGQP